MVAACWTDGNLEHNYLLSSNATETFPFPTGYQIGHLLLVFAALYGHNTYPGSPAAPAGWTKVTEHELAPRGGSDFFQKGRLVVFGKVIDGTEGGSVTLTSSRDASDPTSFKWLTSTVWVTAKRNADEVNKWLDDWASVADALTVPALTSQRTDNVYFYFGVMASSGASMTPTGGWCNLEDHIGGAGGGGNQIEVGLSVKRIDTLGSTGTVGLSGDGPKGAVGLLIPCEPYPWGGPTVGFIGSGVF